MFKTLCFSSLCILLLSGCTVIRSLPNLSDDENAALDRRCEANLNSRDKKPGISVDCPKKDTGEPIMIDGCRYVGGYAPAIEVYKMFHDAKISDKLSLSGKAVGKPDLEVYDIRKAVLYDMSWGDHANLVFTILTVGMVPLHADLNYGYDFKIKSPATGKELAVHHRESTEAYFGLVSIVLNFMSGWEGGSVMAENVPESVKRRMIMQILDRQKEIESLK
ncbi:MAG: hypothetical protein WC637_09700 [Victivallales bacterium]|jgi:hypothetical protein